MTGPSHSARRAAWATTALLCLGILLGGSTRSLQAQPRTVFAADELQAAGVTRLTDLWLLLEQAAAYTTDGFTWHASLGGLALPRQEAWTLLVDGQPLDITALGISHLNALALGPAALDSVVVHTRPVVAAGAIRTGGVVALYTRQPETTEVRGLFSGGNEIADPGPYRYTPFASPNIDRVGPAYELGAAVVRDEAGRTGSAVLLHRGDQQHATDERLIRRIAGLYTGDRKPRLILSAQHAAFRLTTQAPEPTTARHLRVSAGRSWLDDLRFEALWGREVPAEQRLRYVLLDGRAGPWTYGATAQGLTLAERRNRQDLRYGWGQQHGRAYVQRRIPLGNGHLAVSAQGRIDRATWTLPDETRTRGAVEVLAHLTLPFSSRVRHDLALAAERTHGFWNVTGLAESAIRLAPRHDLLLTGTVERPAPFHPGELWYWALQDWAVLSPFGAAPPAPAAVDAGLRTTGDALWTWRPAPAWRLHASGGLRMFHGETFVVHRYDPVAQGERFDVDSRVVTGQRGFVLRSGLAATYRPSLRWVHRLSVRSEGVTASTTGFVIAWSPAPTIQGHYRAHFAPNPRFGLWANLGLRGASRWPEYQAAEARTAGRIPDRVPPYVLLDIAATKRLWDDHAVVTLAVRNALDAPLRTHPAGAVDRLTFYVQLRVRL